MIQYEQQKQIWRLEAKLHKQQKQIWRLEAKLHKQQKQMERLQDDIGYALSRIR